MNGEIKCYSPSSDRSTCTVEAIVSIDGRGQMVLPKELRECAGIRGRDKLVVVSYERYGKVSCISLIRAETLSRMVKGVLSPAFIEYTYKESEE